MFGNNRKKGVYFTIDALLFALIILSSIIIIPTQFNSSSSSSSQITFIAKDTIGIMQTMQIHQLNHPWVEAKITDGNITNLNNTLIEQIGEFWALNKTEFAGNLSELVLEEIVPDYLGKGVWINDEAIYRIPTPPKTHMLSGRQIVSGLEKNKTIYGYVARAQATNVKSHTSKIISISPEGAGWNKGNVLITKHFNLSNITINDAKKIISVHADSEDSAIWVDFNDGQCHYVRNDFSWEYGDEESNIGTKDVSSCLVEGINKLQIYLENRWYNAHTHPGMYLELNMTEDILPEINSVNINKRYYFDDILSTEVNHDHAGVWAMFPFFLPEDAYNISVDMQIVGKNVRDYNWGGDFSSWDGKKYKKDYDFVMFINKQDPFDRDRHPPLNPVYRYNRSQVAPYLINGTNVVSVYFNNYKDSVWGDGWTRLYSDPFNDPEGSSYIDVNYTIPSELTYGLIEISNYRKFSAPDDNDKTISFSYPSEAVMKSDTFLHLGQKQSSVIDVWADVFNPPVTKVFESPSKRAIPTTTYIDNSHFSLNPGIINYVRVRDDGSDNEFSSIYSSIEYRFYVPSFVGYKDVFSTEEEAIEDANWRLNESIGEFLDISGIVITTDSITDVPSLWGPAIVEVRVWD